MREFTLKSGLGLESGGFDNKGKQDLGEACHSLPLFRCVYTYACVPAEARLEFALGVVPQDSHPLCHCHYFSRQDLSLRPGTYQLG